MEIKKNPKSNLENYSKLFIQLGLVLALFVVYVSIEHKTYDRVVGDLGIAELSGEEEEEMVITSRPIEVKPPPPPPPPKVADVLNIVEDDVELDEELDIEDTEMEEDTEVDFSDLAMDEEEAEDAPVFFIVEDMPEFPGGEEALRKFIATSVKYPVIAQENGIQGRVYVSFVVNTKGKVTDVKIARGVDPNLDKEAIRVVNSMPAWKPGRQRGKAVKVSYTVPINFVLQ